MTEDLRERLRTIPAPDPFTDGTAVADDIVAQGLVGEITVEGETATIELALGAPHSPAETELVERIREAVDAAGYEPALSVRIDDDTPASGGPIVIAVSSGKGGVGKSTISTNLAAGIADRGASVGLFDADVFGPNIPRMLGVADEMVPPGGENTILPVDAGGIQVLSVGFMVDDSNPITWRGPVVDQMLSDLWHDVAWDGVEYLVVDLPPGTGDAQLTMLQQMPVLGSVVVTTPQDVALDNVRKGISQFEPYEAEVFGLVENMSTFVCPNCGEGHAVFPTTGAAALADEFDVPLLGRIPLDPAIGDHCEAGEPIVFGETETAEIFRDLAGDVMDAVGRRRRHAHSRNNISHV
ncbi:Mrp/NBP35 family ATP-binding protein [Halorubrum vacuolatum]|uniref:Iron-sulfur cluster carrier protein n=1 Tax=Halorubrum vacuolatum TaxID=63740 RepID=A0A238WI59_HALVU|nr:Mrp/NBP35 family ATP-binding protein [Halorubrum vacuolatum]SNR46013.1 ATP-binding protein involved in chromosome partitioning [Halorubrum vacuolatum]